VTATTEVRPAADQFRLGLLLAVGSAFAFGMSGPLGKSLMEAGWSPIAAVTARLAGGAVAMAIFATLTRPGWVREALQHWKTVIAYGIVPIAGAQLCYYNAVSHLSVGVALLLEYTSPVLVVGWLWATSKRRPSWPSPESCWCSTSSRAPTSISRVSPGDWPPPSARRATS
jgi:drug/metabolite transporter (DMT)-like permease